MITIVHIIGDANLSGVPHHVLQLATLLPTDTLRQVVIGPDGPIVAQFNEKKINYHIVPMVSKFDRSSIRSITDKVSDIARQDDKVIIHCHGVRAGLLGRLAVRSLGLPVIYTEHSWTNDYHLPNRMNEWFQVAMLRYLNQYTTRTVAVSKAVAQFLSDKRIADPATVTVIPHGIALLSQRLSLVDSLTIGSVGSLTWQKNYGWLLDVMAEVVKKEPAVKLEIVGAGPQQHQLQQQINRLGLNSSVRLVGAISSDKLSDYYRRWALYIQSSTNESFGLAVAEAMAAGLPALGTKVGSLPELLVSKEALLPKSPKKAAEAILAYLSSDKKRAELQAQQYAKISELTVDQMISAYVKLYRSLIN